ncbi:hypothetical protein [Pseudotenacibaculum haliotis]|uniref:Tail fiber protein n=1 Tax=Pseudotenacibaculum haliotis TaxID=1862138 RepID=A0ABW5LYZ0_9FLAO
MKSEATSTQTLQINNIPKGGIIMWSQPITHNSELDGWAICDGQNGTPDLRDKFVRGVGENTPVGTKDGQDSIQLTKDHLPAHCHAITDPGHCHSLSIHLENPKKTPKGKGNKDDLDSTIHSLNPHTMGKISDSTTGITIKSEGNSSIPPIDNRPEFYSLYYIMKL